MLHFGALEAIADYPPLALYELGAAARVYGAATSNRWEDSAAFTVFIKSIPVAFEAALCALLFVDVCAAAPGNLDRPLGGRRPTG